MSTANFRTSLGGFHRADVVNFIEETSLTHEKAIRNLKDEIGALQTQLSAMKAEKDALLQELAEKEKEIAAYVAASSKQETPTASQEASPDSPSSGLDELELAAYRRAEAMERTAQLRAQKLLQQVNGIVENVAAQFSSSKNEIADLGADLQTNLKHLQNAFSQLQLQLEVTSRTLSQFEPLLPES